MLEALYRQADGENSELNQDTLFNSLDEFHLLKLKSMNPLFVKKFTQYLNLIKAEHFKELKLTVRLSSFR